MGGGEEEGEAAAGGSGGGEGGEGDAGEAREEEVVGEGRDGRVLGFGLRLVRGSGEDPGLGLDGEIRRGFRDAGAYEPGEAPGVAGVVGHCCNFCELGEDEDEDEDDEL